MSGDAAYRKPALVNTNIPGGIEFCPFCHKPARLLGKARSPENGKPMAKYRCENPLCSMLHYTRMIGPGGK
ncbi:MAG: hypothetical protein PHI12_07865 [Dehalococcoidales bacterium]|jgi:hypothetical protein|nr:hypothetical protein [Dehalococcoidales bacterium]